MLAEKGGDFQLQIELAKTCLVALDLKEVKGDKESKSAYKARIKDTKHPLIEKIFKEYAPKYDARKNELGQGGGYTRILKTGNRRGDAAETCILQLI